MKKIKMQNSRSVWTLLLFLFWSTALCAQQTVKILAIRVEFQADENSLTTGTGKFDLSLTPQDSVLIIPDPAPHNKYYFEDHLLYLKNYYQAVSNRQLSIEFDCFPENVNEAYQLPHEMGYYNPNTSPEAIDKGLAELFRDAWTVAAKDSAIHFSQYNCFLLFHAGVGRDINQGFDETPQDIPSIYIKPDFLEKNIGISAIDVGNGMFVSEGAILPETESQGEYQLAMNGVVAANFGTFLGMPDMFNSKTGRPGVGIFDLMDVGLFNAQGFLPSVPMAWHRLNLGWQNASVISGVADTVLKLGNIFSDNEPSIYKFPISSDEYFLVEFRNPGPISFDSAAYLDAYNLSVKQTLLKHFADQVEFSERGVLTNVTNFDLSLPTNGALIWHVDENVVKQRLLAGEEINNDPRHKGVDLEEADGSQDIGEEFSGLSGGSGSENGYIGDMYFEGNKSPVFIENGNAFSPHTIPSSNSYYLHAVSGIHLEDFSFQDSVLTFRAKHDLFSQNFPITTGIQNIKKIIKVPNFSSQNDEQLFLYNSNQVARIETENDPGIRSRFYLSDSIISVFPGLPASRSLLVQTSKALYWMQNTGSAWAAIDSVIQVSGWKRPLTMTRLDSSVVVWGASATGVPVAWELANNGFLAFPFSSSMADQVEKLFTVYLNGHVYAAIISSGGTMTIGDLTTGQNLLSYSEWAVKECWWVVSKDKTTATLYFSTEKSIYSFDLANVSLQELFGENSGNIRFTPMQWNNYGQWMLAFAMPGDQLSLANKNGSTFLHFPLSYHSPDEQVTYDEIFPVVENTEQTQAISIYLPVLVTVRKTLQNHEDKLNSKVLMLYNQEGSVESEYLLPLGQGNIVPYFDARESSFRLYTVDSAGVFSAFDFPFRPLQASVWSNLNDYNSRVMEWVPLNDDEKPSYLSGLLPENLVYNWPNPVKDETTQIRFFVTEDALVTIKIFSSSGIKVWDRTVSAQGNVDTDVIWDVRNIPSGVYLAKISAKSGNKNEEKIIRIAVVH